MYYNTYFLFTLLWDKKVVLSVLLYLETPLFFMSYQILLSAKRSSLVHLDSYFVIIFLSFRMCSVLSTYAFLMGHRECKEVVQWCSLHMFEIIQVKTHLKMRKAGKIWATWPSQKKHTHTYTLFKKMYSFKFTPDSRWINFTYCPFCHSSNHKQAN